MKLFRFLALIIILSSFPLRAQISFEGAGEYQPIKISAPASSGLNDIYVVWTTNDISINYQSSGSSSIEWLIYSNLGGGYAEEISGINKNGNIYTLNNPAGNHGYIINDNGKSYIFWLVDYSQYRMNSGELSMSEESNCDMTILYFGGNASPINYYTVNGRQENLSREISLIYNNLDWSDQDSFFIEQEEVKTLPYINETINLSPPLYCPTEISLSGDRFLKKWGIPVSASFYSSSPIAVAVKAKVETEESEDTDQNEENSNQIGSGGDGLGGSAPFNANFISYFTDAVIHYEWQITTDPEFENIDYRIYQQDLDYTFTEEGQHYVRFVGSNSDGSCEAFSDIFTIFIGASELKIPNAFSPNGDGVNDIWKVAYRSLLEFKCWIFDRHGHQIYYFDDPNGGWDGKNGSKFVNPGVYFYVIEAKGSDGRKYKKKGDINILNSRTTGGNYTEEEE